MAPGSGVFYGVSRKPGRLLEHPGLTSVCEEFFKGKLEATLVPDCYEKSDERQQKKLLVDKDTEYTEGWAESFENQLGRALRRKVKLAQSLSV